MKKRPVNSSGNPAPLPQAKSPSSAAAVSSSAPGSGLESNIPELWPGAFGAYKYSRDAVRFNLAAVIGLLVLSFAFACLQLIPHFRLEGYIIGSVVSGLCGICLFLVYLAGVREQHLSISRSFSESLPLLPKMIGLYILIYASYVISFLLVIVPFFIVFPRLMLAPYYLIDKKLGIIEAYKASWNASEGHSLQVWGVLGTNALIGILVITIIGIPISIYLWVMYSAVFAVLYVFIDKTMTGATPASPGGAPPKRAALTSPIQGDKP